MPSQKKTHDQIVSDAAILGVERTHLWRVLTGKRKSQSLLMRYNELRASRGEPPFATPQDVGIVAPVVGVDPVDPVDPVEPAKTTQELYADLLRSVRALSAEVFSVAARDFRRFGQVLLEKMGGQS